MVTSLGNQDEALATLDGMESVWLYGKTLDAHISASITDSSITRAINAVAQFSLTFNDSRRIVARSGLFGAGVTCVAGKYPYSCISISKSGEEFTVAFEDEIVTRLQEYNTPYVVKPGHMTHVQFVEHLLRPHKWLKFHTVDNPSQYGVIKSLTTLNRGTPAGKSAAKPEGTWSAINRIGAARGWRTFIRGVDELWYVPDTYLFAQPLEFTLSEDDEWIDDIDYDINIRTTVAATCQLTVQAAEWAIPPGSVVYVQDAGPAHGKWLVQDITREPLSNPQATITLIHPTKPLPEPVPNATSNDTSPGGSGTAPISKNKATAVAQYAIAAGFSGSSLLTAVQVSFAEDGSHSLTATNHNSNGTLDRGLWQINSSHSQYDSDAMFDGLKNAKAAYDISSHGKNWQPWTTYNSGAYIRYQSQANRAISEAEALNRAAGGDTATVGTGHGGVAPSRTTSKRSADFVNEVLSQKGKQYVEDSSVSYSNSNPRSFDCSGLMQWGAGRVGITDYPRNAESQYEFCRKHGTTISVNKAIHIRGAVLFARGDDPQGTYGIGHTAMSMGNGKDSFEALGTGYGVNEFADIEQFSKAALIPGMKF